MLVSKFFTQISLFQRHEETSDHAENCLRSQDEFLPLPFYFTLIFLVQASLNSGKLQQDILQLVKQADNSANSLPNGERERQILETYMESIIENGLEEPVTSILLLNSALK